MNESFEDEDLEEDIITNFIRNFLLQSFLMTD